MRYLVTVDEREISVEMGESGDAAPQANVDGVVTPLDWRVVTAAVRAAAGGADTAGHYSLLLGDQSYDIYARAVATPDGADDEGAQAYEVTVGARTYTVTLRDERTQALGRLAGAARHSGDAIIRAPMPGLVSNVLAQEGQEVARGQAVVVLEAMKMENDLATPRAGVVKRVNVTKGQTVNQGDTLAIIGDPAGSAPGEDTESETETAD
ncbi:MAG TPA: acetyl-CoA carboxylase biotin carboxyl carrier protein subunit [Ktedonobacterales bacterium]|nr:acetyl-CoA carboxylase biotin carboxyl carrier protein subunit [Ktedonobacterales bacterium]